MFIESIITVVIFLLILSVLVLIHEAGHFFVARKFGIRVEEFGFGFPLTPPLWQKKKGDTLYSFYPVLIGGFVKLYGEDEAGGGRIEVAKDKKHKEEDDPTAFYSHSLGQRALVIFAGVFMNVILAALIYYVVLGTSGFKQDLPLIGHPTFFGSHQTINTQVVVSEISKNSPAQKAGITPFSLVVSINGAKVTNLGQFANTVKASVGKPLTITWIDDATNKTHTATLTPRVNPPKGQGAMGVAFYPAQTVTLSYVTPSEKLFSGFVHPANLMVYNFSILGELIGVSVKEKSVAPLKPAVSGPVGIGFVVGSIVSIPDIHDRIEKLLNLAGLLSISLAFFNVLPIPGLDGGRLFFILIEAVFRRKINPRIEGYINAGGMAVLLLLILLVTLNDIQTHSAEIINYFSKLIPK